jgi:septum formation inhibitor-activating ATPase MinD
MGVRERANEQRQNEKLKHRRKYMVNLKAFNQESSKDRITADAVRKVFKELHTNNPQLQLPDKPFLESYQFKTKTPYPEIPQ